MKNPLRCPVCHQPVHEEGKSLKCSSGHSFDRARQGYFNLSRKQKASGDNPEMSKARSRFLASGAYDFLREEICSLTDSLHPQVLIDLGCGEGFYTGSMTKTAEQTYGIDLSTSSIRHAAGQDKKTQYLVGSIYDLPFEDGCADVCTSIFTPLPAAEASRVLKDEGEFITVTPGRMHHYELKEHLYDQVRLNDDLKAPEGFVMIDQQDISRKQKIDDVWSLLEMTPYRYRCSKEALERIRNLKDGLEVTCDFVITRWRKA